MSGDQDTRYPVAPGPGPYSGTSNRNEPPGAGIRHSEKPGGAQTPTKTASSARSTTGSCTSPVVVNAAGLRHLTYSSHVFTMIFNACLYRGSEPSPILIAIPVRSILIRRTTLGLLHFPSEG
jgi:hypothetical protein